MTFQNPPQLVASSLLLLAVTAGCGGAPVGGPAIAIAGGTGMMAVSTVGGSAATAGNGATLGGAGGGVSLTGGAGAGSVASAGGVTAGGSAGTAAAGASPTLSSAGGGGGGAGGTLATLAGATSVGGSAAGSPTTAGGSGGDAGGAAIDVEFSLPEGVIPNAELPSSMVNLSVGQWQEGLVSPTLLEGHQINQPSVLNGYLVIAGNESFWIYDVSDPTAPEMLSEFTTPGATGGEAESHNVSFARYGDTFYMVTIGGRGIDTWDVTDVTAPQHLDQLSVPGTNYGDYTEAIWGLSWQGQYIYVGATNNGIKVVDAQDPTALEIVAEVPTSQYGGVSAATIDAIGNVLVVTTPKETGGVATLDISDPTAPTRLASFSTDISYIGQFYRRWVFLITPLRTWDVLSDPENIGVGSSPIGTLNHGGAEYMSFQDDYLFLGHVRTEISGTPGASKIDVSNVASMNVDSTVYGRQDRNGLNDDQFTIAFGNLLVLGDDQAPFAGWVLAAHSTEPDTTPPIVDTVIPNDQATGIATTARVGLSFTDNIELATVNAASFFVRPVGGQPLPGKYGVRMGVLSFDPDADLQAGTTYEVVMPAGGVTDLVGNSVEEWSSTFTTE